MNERALLVRWEGARIMRSDNNSLLTAADTGVTAQMCEKQKESWRITLKESWRILFSTGET